MYINRIVCTIHYFLIKFSRNWIRLRDLDTGKIIWQENKDFSNPDLIHDARVPISILDIRAVGREINYSTTEKLVNLRIIQMVKFKGKIMEEWCFTNGEVKANTTNTWISTIEAAPESQMMPAKILNGNVTIQTEFYDEDDQFASSTITLYYV